MIELPIYIRDGDRPWFNDSFLGKILLTVNNDVSFIPDSMIFSKIGTKVSIGDSWYLSPLSYEEIRNMILNSGTSIVVP